MFFRILGFLALATALLAPLSSTADEKANWYEVEIIVFARPGAPVNRETWPDSIPLAPEGIQLSPPGSGELVPFQEIPSSELRMAKAYERLNGGEGVVPLLHLGWLQPGLARDQSVAVRLQSEARDGGRVEGSVRLVLSRYLHLETDLLYRLGLGDAPDNREQSYRLTESRRMRSKEIHYLDHPLFGVVALVTPHEPKGLPAAAPAPGEMKR